MCCRIAHAEITDFLFFRYQIQFFDIRVMKSQVQSRESIGGNFQRRIMQRSHPQFVGESGIEKGEPVFRRSIHEYLTRIVGNILITNPEHGRVIIFLSGTDNMEVGPEDIFHRTILNDFHRNQMGEYAGFCSIECKFIAAADVEHTSEYIGDFHLKRSTFRQCTGKFDFALCLISGMNGEFCPLDGAENGFLRIDNRLEAKIQHLTLFVKNVEFHTVFACRKCGQGDFVFRRNGAFGQFFAVTVIHRILNACGTFGTSVFPNTVFRSIGKGNDRFRRCAGEIMNQFRQNRKLIILIIITVFYKQVVRSLPCGKRGCEECFVNREFNGDDFAFSVLAATDQSFIESGSCL